MGPFELLEPKPPGWLGREPTWNAWVELHNVIAAAATPDEFGPWDRARIGAARGVDLGAAFLGERLVFYAAYLRHLLADGDLTGEERAELAHVAATLGLTPAQRAPVHERAFGRVVVEAIAGGRLSDERRALLYTLQHTLAPDPALADTVYGLLALARVRALVTAALADGLLTDEEAAELEAASEALSVPLPPDTERARVEGRAYAALLQRGVLPALPHAYAPLHYEPGERLHVVAAVGYRSLQTHDLRDHRPGLAFPHVRRGLPQALVAVTSRQFGVVTGGGLRRTHPVGAVEGAEPFEGRLLVEVRGYPPLLLEAPVRPAGEGPLALLKAALDLVARPAHDDARPSERPVPTGALPLLPVELPPELRFKLEPGEHALHVAHAEVGRVDFDLITETFTRRERGLLAEGQTEGLTLAARPAVAAVGPHLVVVTSRRAVLRSPGGRRVSVRYGDLNRLLRFADGVALEPLDARPGVLGWFLAGLQDPGGLYALLTRLLAGGER